MARYARTISRTALTGHLFLTHLEEQRSPSMAAPHWHDGVELTVVHQGTGTFQVADASYPLRPGLVLLIGEHVVHHAAHCPDVPYTVTSCIFCPAYLEPVLAPAALDRLLLPFACSRVCGQAVVLLEATASAALNSALERLVRCVRAGTPAAEQIGRLALAEALVLVGAAPATPPLPQTPELGPAGSGLVVGAMAILRREYAQPWTLDRLARRLHVSRFYLHHQFTRVARMTPRAYLLQCRLQEAQHRLLLGDASVGEIALHVGFRSPTLFSQAFRRHFGVAPRAYRREHEHPAVP